MRISLDTMEQPIHIFIGKWKELGIIREVVHLSLPFVPPLHELKIAGGKGRLLDRDTSINKALFEDKKKVCDVV